MRQEAEGSAGGSVHSGKKGAGLPSAQRAGAIEGGAALREVRRETERKKWRLGGGGRE